MQEEHQSHGRGSPSGKTGSSILSFGRNKLSFIRDKDMYGHPIGLNYRGDKTFKTSFGGCLTIFMVVIVFTFGIIKHFSNIHSKEWELHQHTVIRTKDDLSTPRQLSDPEYANLSLALQFKPKRPKSSKDRKESVNIMQDLQSSDQMDLEKILSDSNYGQSVKELSRYLSIHGNFEKRSGLTYSKNDGAADDQDTW